MLLDPCPCHVFVFSCSYGLCILKGSRMCIYNIYKKIGLLLRVHETIIQLNEEQL